MLRPKRVTFKKERKGRIRGKESQALHLTVGTYGLKALESGRITARQMEATRRAMTRKMKRRGRVWIRIFPSTPITSKPNEVRMGKGKGNVDHWVSPVREGRILYEIGGIPPEIALQALRAGAAKLPLRTCFLHSQ
jgi:large subunit ribosomal protein L16